jgi:hypothetical protein
VIWKLVLWGLASGVVVVYGLYIAYFWEKYGWPTAVGWAVVAAIAVALVIFLIWRADA